MSKPFEGRRNTAQRSGLQSPTPTRPPRFRRGNRRHPSQAGKLLKYLNTQADHEDGKGSDGETAQCGHEEGQGTSASLHGGDNATSSDFLRSMEQLSLDSKSSRHGISETPPFETAVVGNCHAGQSSITSHVGHSAGIATAQLAGDLSAQVEGPRTPHLSDQSEEVKEFCRRWDHYLSQCVDSRGVDFEGYVRSVKAQTEDNNGSSGPHM